MKLFNKKTILALGVCGLLGTTNAVAGLQSFQTKETEESGLAPKCGYKNDTGKVIVAAKYDSCGNFNDGLARVVILKTTIIKDFPFDRYLQGYINESGKLVIPVEHAADISDHVIDYRDFKEGMVAVYKNEKYGYLNTAGKLAIPYLYQSAGDFHDGLAVVSKNDKYGVIDKTGKTVVPFKFNWLDSYSEGLAKYSTVAMGLEEGEYGYIDQSGKIAIPPKFGAAMAFSEGLAAVRIDSGETSKWGIIDKSGKVVIAPKYDQVYLDMGEFPSVDGGRYKNGKLDVYKVNKKVNSGDDHESITRYTIDRTGKVISQKNYADWNDIEPSAEAYEINH